MPQPPLGRDLADEIIEVMNECLASGYALKGSPSAIAETARRLKIHPATANTRVQAAERLYGLKPTILPKSSRERAPPQPPPDRVITALEPPIDALKRLLRRTPHTIEMIAEALHLTPGGALDLCIELKQSGLNVHKRGEHYSIEKDMAPAYAGEDRFTQMSTPDNKFRFGVVADSHIGSKYARNDVLSDIYDRFRTEGITHVYHCGNWIEGEARFNKTDLLIHGMDNQIQALVDIYPQREGITTYAVAGDDHEGWYGQREGIDIGRYAEMKMREAGRTDWKNLGYMEAHVNLTNVNTQESATLAVVHPGGGCFDHNAEILTKDRGWIPFSELTRFDYVATMRQDNHEFQWQNPTRITNEAYSGKMVHLKTRTFRCNVTPNHRFMVRRYETARRVAIGSEHPEKARWRHSPDWQIVSAAEIVETYARQRWAFPTVSQGWVGNYTPTVSIPRREPKKYASSPIFHCPGLAIEDAAELIGWFASEGHVSKNRKVTVISQYRSVNPENHAQIVDLMERCGFPYGVFDNGVRVHSVEISEWLAAECGVGSANKKIPTWLKDQPPEILRVALDALIAGDGWVNGRAFGYKTISKRLADDVSEIAQKCGFGVSFNCPDGREWSLGLRLIQNTPTLNTPPELFDYDGRVYCCTVPNGMIYVRSHGKAFWSHNSSYAVSYVVQKILESLEGGNKPAVALYGHYHKMLAGEYRNVWYMLVPSTKDQDIFMRKKRLSSVVGGGIIELEQDPATGAITSFVPRMWRYFDKGYYDNDRWSHSGPVVLPKRLPL